ncbi:MAG: hypothetical protein V3T24_00520 [Longimicrobiales bacterium]
MKTSDFSIGSPATKSPARIATAVSRSATHASASTEGMTFVIDSAGHMPMRTDSIRHPPLSVKLFGNARHHFDD